MVVPQSITRVNRAFTPSPHKRVYLCYIYIYLITLGIQRYEKILNYLTL